jgi:hypothetical protein
MSSAEIQKDWWFYADPFYVEHVAPSLGPDGSGVALFRQVIAPDYIAALRQEMADSGKNIVAEFPLLQGLTNAVENLVRYDLAQYFPVLADWQMGSTSVHHYDADSVQIAHSPDPSQLWHVTPIALLDGNGEFSVTTDSVESSLKVVPGDLAIVRGTDLQVTHMVSE